MSHPPSRPCPGAAGRDSPSRLGAAISDAIAGLLRDAVGRGPRRVRTHVHDDVVVAVIHGTMTPLEQTLVDDGREAAVREIRTGLHAALESPAQVAVERLTGRRVLATFADHRAEPDAGVLVFLLQGVPDEAAVD